jgi:hypothetical protein
MDIGKMIFNSTDADPNTFSFHMKVTEEYPLLHPSEAKIAASISVMILIFGTFVQVKSLQI